MNIEQAIQRVIVPVLEDLTFAGIGDVRNAAAFLAAIGQAESGFEYQAQLQGGPARSWWQIEPATAMDVLAYWKRRDMTVAEHIEWYWPTGVPPGCLRPDDFAYMLETSPWYACAMARLFWTRFPEPLPSADSLGDQAKAWKARYNTPAGKGTVPGFVLKVRSVHDRILAAVDPLTVERRLP